MTEVTGATETNICTPLKKCSETGDQTNISEETPAQFSKVHVASGINNHC